MQARQSEGRILAFGDSHVFFWSGSNQIGREQSAFHGMDLAYLGPATAHNLVRHQFDDTDDPNSATKSVIPTLVNAPGKYECLLLSFGEIDCRVHIVRHAAQNSCSIDDAVEVTVERYFAFIDRLIEQFGVPCILWGPTPSSPPDNFIFNPEFPAVGSIIERNYATCVFNQKLAGRAASRRDVAHVSLFDRLIGNDLATRTAVLYDGCHLDAEFLQEAAGKVRAALVDLGLPHLLPAMGRRWPIAGTARLQNFAAGRTYKTSSCLHGSVIRPFDAEPNGHVKFHTDLEFFPWLVLDLDIAHAIEKIVVHNRSDCQERARSLVVSLSRDCEAFHDIYAPAEYRIFHAFDDALVIDTTSAEPARYVRLHLREKTFLHLDCVQVFARTFITP